MCAIVGNIFCSVEYRKPPTISPGLILYTFLSDF